MILNTYRPHASDARQVDDRRRVDESVALVDDADVVDRNALMLLAAEASVNMPTDHDPPSGELSRSPELASTFTLGWHATFH
jgi:hypothetical protein